MPQDTVMVRKSLKVTVDDISLLIDTGHEIKPSRVSVTVGKIQVFEVTAREGQSLDDLAVEMETNPHVRSILRYDVEYAEPQPKPLDDLAAKIDGELIEVRRIITLRNLVLPIDYDDFNGYYVKGYREGKHCLRNAIPQDSPDYAILFVDQFLDGGILGYKIVEREILRDSVSYTETNPKTKEGKLKLDITLHLVKVKDGSVMPTERDINLIPDYLRNAALNGQDRALVHYALVLPNLVARRFSDTYRASAMSFEEAYQTLERLGTEIEDKNIFGLIKSDISETLGQLKNVTMEDEANKVLRKTRLMGDYLSFLTRQEPMSPEAISFFKDLR